MRRGAYQARFLVANNKIQARQFIKDYKGIDLLKCKASLHALQEGPEALSRSWPRRTQHGAQGETLQLALGITADTTRPWAS